MKVASLLFYRQISLYDMYLELFPSNITGVSSPSGGSSGNNMSRALNAEEEAEIEENLALAAAR